MSLSNICDVDDLQLWTGEPYQINKYVTIFQPTIRDIIKYGERDYFSVVNTITANSSDMKSSLWDAGLDWCEIEDFQLFMMLCPTLPNEKTKILLGDLDLQKLKPYRHQQNDEVILMDVESGATVDELAYKKMVSYICKLHNITKKVEHAANKRTKRVMIDEDRRNIKLNKDKPYKSFMLSMLTSVKARQGYTKDYMLNMGLNEFMTEVARLQIIVNSDALLQGSYSGMIDTSKINKSAYNWMRDIEE